jgi:hypothetical protein
MLKIKKVVDFLEKLMYNINMKFKPRTKTNQSINYQGFFVGAFFFAVLGSRSLEFLKEPRNVK